MKPTSASGLAREETMNANVHVTSPASPKPQLHKINTDLYRHLLAGRDPSNTTASSATENIFNHLNTIQQLQRDITAEHAQLESLDTADIKVKADQRASREDTSFGQAADNTARDRRNQEGRNAAAAEAYDNLAAGFKERQKGVESIMDKLAQLSKSVKEFHAIPPPVLFPDSRMVKSGVMVDTPLAMSPKQGLP